MSGLKLAAFDVDDLGVISAHMQDAILSTTDLAFMAKEQRFALIAQRFAWEAALSSQADPAFQPLKRCLTSLRFERVQKVRTKNLDRTKAEVLELLAVQFKCTQAPEGTLSLFFANGCQIELDVECLEVVLSDLDPNWSTSKKPHHETEENI